MTTTSMELTAATRTEELADGSTTPILDSENDQMEETKPKQKLTSTTFPDLQKNTNDNDAGSTTSSTTFVSANRLHKRRQRLRNQNKRQNALDGLLQRIPSSMMTTTMTSTTTSSSILCNKRISNDGGKKESSLPSTTTTGTTTTGSSSVAIEDVYKPIPIFYDKKKFWSKIPDSCNPQTATMTTTTTTTTKGTDTKNDKNNNDNNNKMTTHDDNGSSTIVNASKLARDKRRQVNYKKKLQRMVENGKITRQEQEELWQQHGRQVNSIKSSADGNVDNNDNNDIDSRNNDDDDNDKESKDEKRRNDYVDGGKNTSQISLLSSNRGQRKAWQVENFVSLLHDKFVLPSTKITEDTSIDQSTTTKMTTTTIQSSLSPQQPKQQRNRNRNRMIVVDFGCGSGNLTLSLASYFTNIQFVLVDKKSYPLELAKKRANQANLENVHVLQYTFDVQNLSNFKLPSSCYVPKEVEKEDDDKNEHSSNANDIDDNNNNNHTSFDLGIGLHSCGSFTDMVMELCLQRGADCIVCPCCNGGITCSKMKKNKQKQKLKQNDDDDNSNNEQNKNKNNNNNVMNQFYMYPRSQHFQRCMTEEEYVTQLSKSADDLGNYAAKCWIEYDRALWASERGYSKVTLWKMTPVECSPKHHVLYLQQ